jgi:hypothetical protein
MSSLAESIDGHFMLSRGANNSSSSSSSSRTLSPSPSSPATSTILRQLGSSPLAVLHLKYDAKTLQVKCEEDDSGGSESAETR